MIDRSSLKGCRTSDADREKVFGDRIRLFLATDPVEFLAQRFFDSPGHRLAGFFRDHAGQIMDFGVLDIQRHDFLL
jgi:hypothetical protein